jgi:hypothetical protein
MRISISDLKTDRHWRSSTGYDEARFRELLNLFGKAYEKLNGLSIEEVKSKSPMESRLNSYEELLFFTLFSLKSGLTYDLLGLVTGMDGSNAKRNQQLGISVLKEALSSGGFAPKREFKNVEEFKELFKDIDSIIIDGTEQRMQRPKDNEKQKDSFSGKKNRIQ